MNPSNTTGPRLRPVGPPFVGYGPGESPRALDRANRRPGPLAQGTHPGRTGGSARLGWFLPLRSAGLAGLFEAFHAMNLDRPEHVELDIDVLPNGPV